MKKLFKIIHVNESIFKRVDAAEQNMIRILALTTPVSAFVCAIVFFYSIDLLMDSTIAGLAVAGLIGYLLLLHDTTLLVEPGLTRSYFRLALSLAIAMVVAVPLKVHFAGDDLKNRYLASIETFNQDIDAQRMADVRALDVEQQKLQEKVAKEGRAFADRGNKYGQGLVEARRVVSNFKETKEERIDEITTLYEAKKRTAEFSQLDLVGFFVENMFEGEDTNMKDTFINMTIFILLLLLEASPAIARIKLEDGKYIHKISHNRKLSTRTDDEIERIEEEILAMEDLDNLPDKLEEIRLHKELEIATNSGFSDTDRLIELSKQFKAAKQRKQTTPPPTSNSSNGSDNTNGRPADGDGFAEFEYVV